MILSDEDKVIYLANLVAVSRADKGVSPNEIHAIEEAQKRISARKTDLKKADTVAQAEGFSPTPIGPFSTRIANLEDMMLISLADGVLDQAEKPLILEFARRIGITNDQLQIILSEVRQSLSEPDATRACPSCSAKVPRQAKFCPSCGTSLDQSDKAASVAVEYSIPSVGIAVEFAESTASGFADAVRRAKAAPENAECLKGKKTWYMAAWPRDQIAEVAKLANDLKGMRNRKVWVDGQESPWDDVFGFSWCLERQNTAYRPSEYCFGIDEKRLNLWGCKNARLDWAKWADWFSYGVFKKAGFLKGGHTFVFDKQRIRHELETNLFRFRYCPKLNFRLIDAVLSQLPDEVDVTPNGQWGYKEEYDASPGSVKVQERVVQDGYTYTKEFHSSGVVPRSPEVGLQILKKALQTGDVDSSEVKGVLTYRGD